MSELRKPYVVKAIPVNPAGVHPADPHGPWPPNRTLVVEVKRSAEVHASPLPPPPEEKP